MSTKKFRFPSHVSNNLKEHKLGMLLRNYIHPQSTSFDLSFVNTLKVRFDFQYKNEKTEEKKKEIDSFYEKYGYLPSERADDPESLKLVGSLSSLLNKNGRGYDEEFAIKHKDSLTYNEFKRKKNWEQALLFRNKNGYWPSSISKNKKEKVLGIFVKNCSVKTNTSYHEEYAKIIEKGPSWLEFRTQQVKKTILDFINKYKRKPSFSNKNIKEKKLAWVMAAYCSPIKGQYDAIFTRQVESLYKKLGI